MPRLIRMRAVPWLIVLDLAIAARDHWGRLTPRDRARIAAIVKKSKGLPANLSPREREELKRLVAKLEPVELVRRVVPFGGRTPGLAGRRGR
jgi:hypothetical protein